THFGGGRRHGGCTMGAALKVHRVEGEDSAREIVLLDCINRIREADQLAAKSFDQWLCEVGLALKQAHAIHQKAGGPNSNWSKWLKENTRFSQNHANRIIKWH